MAAPRVLRSSPSTALQEEPEVVLKLGGEVVTARLFTKQAPNTCAQVLEVLPLEGRLTHAKHVDDEIIFMLPFINDGFENFMIPKAGYLFVWRFTLCIWFGPTTIEALPNCFGRVVDNLDGLATVGRTVWAEQGLPIRIERKEAVG